LDFGGIFEALIPSWEKRRERRGAKSKQINRNYFLQLLGQLPARLTARRVAWRLNCQPHDIPALVAARLLKSLGNPQPNSVKYFAAQEVLERAKEPTRLAKITNTINHRWQRMNSAKKPTAAPGCGGSVLEALLPLLTPLPRSRELP